MSKHKTRLTFGAFTSGDTVAVIRHTHGWGGDVEGTLTDIDTLQETP